MQRTAWISDDGAVTRWTRTIVLPLTIAIPLLGIVSDVVTTLLARDELPPPPWRNPSTVVWSFWVLLVPLILLLEERKPLRRAPAFHALALATIVALHIAFSTFVNSPERNLPGFIWLDRLPRYLAIDLIIYALILTAAYAIRSHIKLRERERAAAALEADVRRAEVAVVRHSIEPERVFRELEEIRDDIGRDSRRAEQRIESLSDHLERQLATIATLAHDAREPLQNLREPRRFLGLTARSWLVLAIAPFALLFALFVIPVVASAVRGSFNPVRFTRAAVYPFFMLPAIVLIVAATLPNIRSILGRIAHVLALLVCCVILSTIPDFLMIVSESAIRGTEPRLDRQQLAGSRVAILTRLFLMPIAAAVLAAQYGRRSRSRELDEALLRARLADAQLSALRMQLHPHFLFNTLNTIAGLLEDDPAAARLMTERLERFLHLSLDLGDAHEVPLHEELRFVTTYLEIQRARFGDRLRVELDVDDAIRNALVPPLILQPLVENAIRHGIGPRKSGGTISVRAQPDPDGLALTVADDGEGARDVRDGIGLANTRARLEQLHGPRQRVKIATTIGQGFAVALHLPLRFANA